MSMVGAPPISSSEGARKSVPVPSWSVAWSSGAALGSCLSGPELSRIHCHAVHRRRSSAAAPTHRPSSRRHNVPLRGELRAKQACRAISWTAIAGVACRHQGVVAAEICGDATVPNLPTCFEWQPSDGGHSCYRFKENPEGIPIVACAYESNPEVDKNGTIIPWPFFECRNDTWMAGRRGDFECRAAPKSVWRLVAEETTLRGWWVNEVKFYRDSACSKQVPSSQIRLIFDRGPAGTSKREPITAFDGNMDNFWRAPCIADDSYDLCGCKTYAGEGWSYELGRCMPNTKTNGRGEEACVERMMANDTTIGPPEGVGGCPAGAAFLGVHFDQPVEVGCMRIKQFGSVAFSTKALSLHVLELKGWRAVKSWSKLVPGDWSSLTISTGCEPFDLVPEWAEVVGKNNPASHGEERTVKCIAGETKITVLCEEGGWSMRGSMLCEEPDMPDNKWEFQARLEKIHGDRDMLLRVGLGLLGVVFGSLLLIGCLLLLRCCLRTRLWKSFARRTFADPEEHISLTKIISEPFQGDSEHFTLTFSDIRPSPNPGSTRTKKLGRSSKQNGGKLTTPTKKKGRASSTGAPAAGQSSAGAPSARSGTLKSQRSVPEGSASSTVSHAAVPRSASGPSLRPVSWMSQSSSQEGSAPSAVSHAAAPSSASGPSMRPATWMSQRSSPEAARPSKSEEDQPPRPAGPPPVRRNGAGGSVAAGAQARPLDYRPLMRGRYNHQRQRRHRHSDLGLRGSRRYAPGPRTGDRRSHQGRKRRLGGQAAANPGAGVGERRSSLGNNNHPQHRMRCQR
eukprot:TRINITY_DN4972_c0_g1_i6.p1 TRINITY_DN4972_c0_g1~~TRINITY_DN4972_c0_g1_i6.p1  ORF type:complete len:793 (+),score=78.86 TRINITY_DN4972_c0_g1_i6:62-2440(+)